MFDYQIQAFPRFVQHAGNLKNQFHLAKYLPAYLINAGQLGPTV
jgi:hypothetical protein